MIVVGILLIIIGFAAMIAGITGGITTMFREMRREHEQSFSVTDLPTEFVEALTKLIQALAAAPIWLALTAIGIGLVVYGGTLI